MNYKPQADLKSGSAVNKLESLTTELWWYLVKSIDKNTRYEITILWCCVQKSTCIWFAVVNYLKTVNQILLATLHDLLVINWLTMTEPM